MFMQLSSSGATAWFIYSNGTAGGVPWQVATTSSGDALIANSATRSLGATSQFGGCTVSLVTADYNYALFKVTPGGTATWCKIWGGTGNIVIYGLAVDSAGNIWSAGTLRGTLTYGSSTLTSLGSNDMMVLKADANGNALFGYRFGGTSFDFLYIGGIATDFYGNAYASGSFGTQMTVEGTTYTAVPAGNDNPCVLKFNASASPQWVATFGGSYSNGAGVTVDATTGNPVATGYYCGSITIGSATYTDPPSACGTYVVELQGTPVPTPAPTKAPTQVRNPQA